MALAFGAATEAQAQAKLTPVPVVYAVLAQATMPVFVGMDLDAFKKNGLDVTLRYVQAGSQPLAALVSGQCDIYIGTGDYVPASLAGGDAVAVASISKPLHWALFVKPGIDKIEDLKGKRLGTPGGTGTSGRSASQFLLRKHGVQDNQITYVSAGNTVNELAGMAGGSLDAGIMLSPQSDIALKTGYKLLGYPRDEGWESVPVSIVVTRKFLKEHRDVVKAFIKAEAAGALAEDKDPGLMRAALTKVYQGGDPAVIEGAVKANTGEFPEIPRAPSDAAIQDVLDGLALTNPAAKDARPRQFVDHSVVDELIKEGAFPGAK
jgi:NitT/TauT family transport system substrate-binding protein